MESLVLAADVPSAAIWVPFVVAAICLVYAAAALFMDRSRRQIEDLQKLVKEDGDATEDAHDAQTAKARAQLLDAYLGVPDDRVAAIVVAGLLVLLGTAAAVIGEKVSEPERGEPAQSVELSASEQAAFNRIEQLQSGKLAKPLCLVRYHARGEPPAGRWWTSCGFAQTLKTVADVRRKLALKKEWGAYDARVRYEVPAGTDVTYLFGTVAPQGRHRGGGVQYLFPDGLDPGGAPERCAPAHADNRKAQYVDPC